MFLHVCGPSVTGSTNIACLWMFLPRIKTTCVVNPIFTHDSRGISPSKHLKCPSLFLLTPRKWLVVELSLYHNVISGKLDFPQTKLAKRTHPETSYWGLSHALGLLVSVSRQLFFGFMGPGFDAMLWCLVFQERWRWLWWWWGWWCCSSRQKTWWILTCFSVCFGKFAMWNFITSKHLRYFCMDECWKLIVAVEWLEILYS